MILLILCLVPRVLSDLSMQHRVYVSRKSRSNSEPFETGYVYKQYYNDPENISTFDPVRRSETSSLPYSTYGDGNTHRTEIETEYITPTQYAHPVDLSKQPIKTYPTRLSSPTSTSYSSVIPESKYTANFLPSKIKTDAMYEKLKLAMHYQPSDTESMLGYENEYHLDDDGMTSSKKVNYDNSWPYYYHNPYEYEHMKIDAEIEKAKDKRYAVDAAKIIPIHEDLSDDIPNSYEPLYTTNYYREASTDNPMRGNEPFFSFTLNDYFNQNHYDDPLVFMGLDWGKTFDRDTLIADIDDYAKRKRRLQSNNNIPDSNAATGSDAHHTQSKAEDENSESITEKGFANNQEFDKHVKNNEETANDKKKYEQKEQKRMGFKDFVDHFTNKFGSEDHKKDSNYILKRNQDKGEKRKGFRRVYHKDEYQEDNEFYDNNNNSVKSEDKGSSNSHIGGSEAVLKSQASANVGDQASVYDASGDREKKKFENNQKGLLKDVGLDNRFNRYRDVAKKAVHSNDVDYFNRY